jgi:hypothetical protein
VISFFSKLEKDIKSKKLFGMLESSGQFRHFNAKRMGVLLPSDDRKSTF